MVGKGVNHVEFRPSLDTNGQDLQQIPGVLQLRDT